MPNAITRIWWLLLLLSLLEIVLAQGLDGGARGDDIPQPAAIPETPEHPDNDIQLNPDPQHDPAVVDVIASDKSDDALPPLDTDPAPPTEEAAPKPASVDEQASPPEEPLPEDEQPQPPHGPQNPWRVPSSGQPAVEIKAGQSFDFSWTPSTEGNVNLELWQIEESTPVPKFLLASDMANSGTYTWKVHSNFPHGTGYCLVIVPADRNLASLSPLFTVIGDIDYDMPTPQATERAFSLNDLEVSHEGTQLKLMIAVGIGFVVCNLFGAFAWAVNSASQERDSLQMPYSALDKSVGNRVFHSRVASHG